MNQTYNCINQAFLKDLKFLQVKWNESILASFSASLQVEYAAGIMGLYTTDREGLFISECQPKESIKCIKIW